MDFLCEKCTKPFQIWGQRARDMRSGKTIRACSKECLHELKSQRAREGTLRNRELYSTRMKTNNPMSDPLAKERAAITRRLGGWKPPTQGGNGKPPPIPQQLLACRLGWNMEIPVATKQKPGSGFPTCYKIDIANESLKIGIEVDGKSHQSLIRKTQDQKKESLLTTLGWTMLRFSNQEVMERLEGCVQTVMSTISKLKTSTPTS